MRFKSILLAIACLISATSPTASAAAMPLVAIIDSGVARTQAMLATGTSFAAPIETARLLASTAMSGSRGASPP